ncbi:acetyl-CoA carboxylase biotin carboxylase subunit [uncultured Paludibaculum sp.]|uniref:acetyl-CoA carboxylase biotin carboxylase subunit n=1 Tax=uncultured Paludibaculum sp. TaxID=1765020 RepID=UPI002AAB4378|nr:acetyl-CoA carboxylase biotin carboxylase subunit [uncultured Paludibaculum sp.]
MFQKILIANRGEIACRVIRTAKKMGIRTVAVYSEADRRALHVRMADEAVLIGAAPSKQSYLCMERIIAACQSTGAEAVHPGYGFLSENAEFVRRLEEAGIVFIGPNACSIDAMGDKIASKKLALQAGVNTIPGYADVIEDADEAAAIAERIGFPVMIKASAGGGGKGLRVAWNAAEAREGFRSCTTEARNAFGDGRVFLEKFIEDPRHIEIQVLGDGYGHLVHLWERECSIQRRHQKLVEEAPSPFLDAATRKAMGEQAVALARAVGYQSAGTVEFVVGKDRRFYFLEMNTRLQVEHPVTELITGLDLVEWMIRVAAGEPLGFTQDEIRMDGWALECRINAEDPFRNFLPSAGRLVKYRAPAGDARVDTGVYEGGEIPVHYDSMIAKLIVRGATRLEAVEKMRSALNAFYLRGVSTNIAFQAALMQHPRFLSGEFHTGFMAEEYGHGFHTADVRHEDPAFLAVIAAVARRRYIDRAVQISAQTRGLQRRVGTDWVVLIDDEKYAIHLKPVQGGYEAQAGDKTYAVQSDWRFGSPVFEGLCNGKPVCLQLERIGLRFHIAHNGATVDAMVMTARAAQLLSLMQAKPRPDLSKFLLSPMPGLLTQLAVEVGQEMKAGERLAVIEAMKMENVLKAEHDVVVDEILARTGDSVAVDQAILRFR